MLTAATGALGRVEAVLDGWRPEIADELLRWIPSDPAFEGILYGPIREHALRPGKALRPCICLATCCALGGSAEAALPTAAVLELYHNAFLVHDDVEDGSLLRRSEPSMHAIYGVPIAVNAGDAMLALALPPLLANARTLGLGKALRVLEVIAAMARETAEGQAIELDWIRRGVAAPDEDRYVEMVARKTASYSFVAPVALGAIIGGAPEGCVARLRAFGRSLGVAFQIRDDVLNLRNGGRALGKEALDDLWEGKRTLVLAHALREASAGERATALGVLGRPRPPAGATSGAGQDGYKRPEEVEFLLGLINRAGSLDHADAAARRLAGGALAELEACDEWLPPSPHRRFLGDLIEFVRQRDH